MHPGALDLQTQIQPTPSIKASGKYGLVKGILVPLQNKNLAVCSQRRYHQIGSVLNVDKFLDGS